MRVLVSRDVAIRQSSTGVRGRQAGRQSSTHSAIHAPTMAAFRQIADRAFSRVVLGKVFGAVAITGSYYAIKGPYVWFDYEMYGVRGALSEYHVMPVGIKGSVSPACFIRSLRSLFTSSSFTHFPAFAGIDLS